ncbi:MAG: Hpt domain-containing protein [Bacilli bacterium]|nr:Hpt domain-containing protein [Bacilli bacterium]
MLSIEALKEFGCDVETGLARCVNNEMLFLRLVSTIPGNENFQKLQSTVRDQDFENAFQAAHGLKGIVANLSLTPLYEPINEITEHLRAKEKIDYSNLLETIEEKRRILQRIVEE